MSAPREVHNVRNETAHQSTGKKILFGIMGGSGQTIVTIMVAFVQIRLILSFLPKDISGIWFLFLSIGAYITYFDLGISPTISREISFIGGRALRDAAGRDQEIIDLIATCQRMFQLIAAIVFILGFLLGGLFLSKISGYQDLKSIGIAWFIFTIGASLNLLGGAAFASLYGMGHVATERLIRAVTQVLGLAISAVALYFGFGIIGLAAAWMFQNIIARLWGWWVLYRYHPELKTHSGNATLEIARRIAGPSLKWAAMGLGAILILQTDNPIIATTIGVASIPSYEAASKIVSALMTFSLLIATSSTPFLSKAYAAGDMQACTTLLMRNVRFGMAVMVMLASFLAVFGDAVIESWLGPGNFVGFPIVWTLLIMLTLEVHHVIHATATMAAGHLVFLWTALASGVMKIALSVVLAHSLGLWGVAIGTMVAQLLTNNWYAPYVTIRLFDLSFTKYGKTVILPVLLLLLSLLLINTGIRHQIHGLPGLPLLAMSFSASSMAWLILTFGLLTARSEQKAFIDALVHWKNRLSRSS